MEQYSLLFPGQGSQYVGMGKSFFDKNYGARLLAQAEEVLGLPLKQLMLLGPKEELTKTAIAQPAILLHSYMAYTCLRENYDISPASLVGHSLGEYTALVAGGVITFEDAIRMVHERGRLMQEAVPHDYGAMAAVLGLDAQRIIKILEDFNDLNAEYYAAVANLNGPAQTVIAGTKAGIRHVSEILKKEGAKRIVELEVSAPFHCALMRPVQERMTAVLTPIVFNDTQVPIISNVSANPETKGERIKDLLIEQIASPVRFTECITNLLNKNLDAKGFIELGPKNILSSIVKKIKPEIFIANIDGVDDRI
jgi:[acyl-carrier-protein] S-malonyltransferase